MEMVADRVVSKMPLQTRAHVLEEGRHDPSFWGYLARIASHPEPGAAIDDEMKRAAINELDPSTHKESAGRWPVLRSKIRAIKQRIAQEAYLSKTGVGDIPGMVTTLDQPTAASSSGSDIWGTIGKALSTVGQVAGSVYSTKIATDAQQDIAKIQAQAAQGIALTQAQQQALAAAKAAAAGGSSSNIVLYILLGVLGLGGLFLLFNMLSKGGRR